MRKESLRTGSEEINFSEPAYCCLTDDVLRECATDAALPLCWSDKNSGDPRSVRGRVSISWCMSIGGAEQLRARRSDKGYGQVASPGALMKYANAVRDGIAGAEICPLAKVPLRESGNELSSICEKLNLHTARLADEIELDCNLQSISASIEAVAGNWPTHANRRLVAKPNRYRNTNLKE